MRIYSHCCRDNPIVKLLLFSAGFVISKLPALAGESAFGPGTSPNKSAEGDNKNPLLCGLFGRFVS